MVHGQAVFLKVKKGETRVDSRSGLFWGAAAATAPDQVPTCCPFCMVIRLDAALKSVQPGREPSGQLGAKMSKLCQIKQGGVGSRKFLWEP